MTKYVSKDNLTQYDTAIKNYFKDKVSNIQELVAYGVQWSEKSTDPHLTRIGNMTMHKELPIQNNMKGCIAQKDTVMYYLDENDWRWRKIPVTQKVTITDNTIVDSKLFATKQYESAWIRVGEEEIQITSIDTTTKTATLSATPATTGSTEIELGAVLNGYDGTVRVLVPQFYLKAFKDNDIRQVWISPIEVDGSWIKQESVLIDAYRSTILRSVPSNMGFLSTLQVGEYISVVNSNAYCRGADNRSDWDSKGVRSDLNKPATYVNIYSQRSKQTKQQALTYEVYKNVMYWLYVIEYANFNFQETYKEDLTSDGFKQGGLGAGVTTMNYWATYNGYRPIVPKGWTDSIGNGTGVVLFPSLTVTDTAYTPYTLANYTRNSAAMDSAMVSNNIHITKAKLTTQYAVQVSWEFCSGTYVYTISGLQEGQTISAAIGGTKFQTISENGDVTIEWGTELKYRQFWMDFTGECDITIAIKQTDTPQITITSPNFYVSRWHGIEQPFGDLWTILDGVIADTSDATWIKVYTCNNPEKFANTITSDYKLLGKTLNKTGYPKRWVFTDNADLLVEELGGSTTSGTCDYYYTPGASSTLRELFVGGYANGGGGAGGGCLNWAGSVGDSWASDGVRAFSAVSWM